ncbi:energy-coupling factor transporter transmembrane component T family protein [Selenomonas sputigena]|uniref:energy-coupling factor transporter transmembrane component T family protein n=1 Tax=Selenomonas sputigena TaxID=69823 RepID=UPI002231245A|nr:energy-coupling factor transporter transmembrane component T [Selenomonas sputigena]UZD43433.1 energy-coupling factor transporter transmembrane protein EcfT [Selenomonas sputigena]
MLKDITLGQFFPGDSLLHRLDPRTKIVLLFFFLAAIFVFDSPLAYAALTAFTAALIAVSRVPLLLMLKALKPLSWIIAFTFVIHLVSTPGDAFFHVWIFDLTWQGAAKGFFIALRLALLILLSALLTYTTSPLALTDALETLMQPAKRVGVPAHEIAMMMTIALRFVPTLIEEADKIMKAQQARGADLTEGSVIERVKGFVPVLVPLFISAFRRADDLALAMEARCYRGGVGRTQMKALRISSIDYVAYAFGALFFAALAVLKFGGIA